MKFYSFMILHYTFQVQLYNYRNDKGVVINYYESRLILLTTFRQLKLNFNFERNFSQQGK